MADLGINIDFGVTVRRGIFAELYSAAGGAPDLVPHSLIITMPALSSLPPMAASLPAVRLPSIPRPSASTIAVFGLAVAGFGAAWSVVNYCRSVGDDLAAGASQALGESYDNSTAGSAASRPVSVRDAATSPARGRDDAEDVVHDSNLSATGVPGVAEEPSVPTTPTIIEKAHKVIRLKKRKHAIRILNPKRKSRGSAGVVATELETAVTAIEDDGGHVEVTFDEWVAIIESLRSLTSDLITNGFSSVTSTAGHSVDMYRVREDIDRLLAERRAESEERGGCLAFSPEPSPRAPLAGAAAVEHDVVPSLAVALARFADQHVTQGGNASRDTSVGAGPGTARFEASLALNTARRLAGLVSTAVRSMTPGPSRAPSNGAALVTAEQFPIVTTAPPDALDESSAASDGSSDVASGHPASTSPPARIPAAEIDTGAAGARGASVFPPASVATPSAARGRSNSASARGRVSHAASLPRARSASASAAPVTVPAGPAHPPPRPAPAATAPVVVARNTAAAKAPPPKPLAKQGNAHRPRTEASLARQYL